MIARLTLLLCLLPAVAAAEIYRYVDEQGNVHYTDEPPARYEQQAEQVEVEPVQTVNSRVPSAPPPVRPSRSQDGSAPAGLYDQVRIGQPANEQTIRDASHTLTVVVQSEPPLRTKLGHGAVFYLDGQRVNDTPLSKTSLTLTDVYRGVHTISVDYVDASGAVIAQTTPVTVFMKPPRVR